MKVGKLHFQKMNKPILNFKDKYMIINPYRYPTGINTLPNDLILLLPMEEDGTAETLYDESTNSYNFGKTTGTIYWQQTGPSTNLPYSVQFTGDAFFLNSTFDNELNGLTSVSASIWVYTSSVTDTNGFFVSEAAAGNDDNFCLRQDASGAFGGGTNVYKSAVDVTTTDAQYESANNSCTTGWHHIVITWTSGERIYFYLDGVADTPSYSGVGTGSIANATAFYVGKAGKNTSPSAMVGNLSQLAIWSRVLTSEEIAALYNSGDGFHSDNW